MKLHWVLKTITNLALTALIVVSFGHPSARGQSPRPLSDRAAQLTALSYFSVFGDFDGDRRLDQAQTHSAGANRCIRVRFGNSLESHLDIGAAINSTGALLARDVNHDNIADLIWVYHSRSESPVVWLSDGLGHFARAAEGSADDLRGMLFGDSGPAVGGNVNDDRASLAPELVSSELPRAQDLEDDTHRAPVIAGANRRHDLGVFLSCLRERGPPSFIHFV